MTDEADEVLWVCYDCGVKHGRRVPGLATWHEGRCCVCGEMKTVTEPRDFGHLIHGCRSMTLQPIVASDRKPEP